MFIDKALQVSNAQAVTASAASTDVIDFGQVNPNVGMDDRSNMAFTCDTTTVSAGASTCIFSIQDCDTEGGTYVDVVASGPIPKASLVAGYQHILPMPTRHRRFVRGYYTVGVANFSAGAFSAQVVSGIQQNVAYPDAL